MAGTKHIVIDAADLLKLLIHYSDGRIPIDAELRSLGVGTRMKRQIGMLVLSQQWPKDELDPSGNFYHPLHIRYEGKKIMSWGKKGSEVFWQDQNDTPKIQ
jgi:hypothetical protein